MITQGQKAPDFSCPDHDGRKVQLADFKSKKIVVLYFYPKDDTPGCTIEAKQFTDLNEAFTQSDSVVLGVSKDSCASHQDFIKKYALSFTLLSDESGELCEKYAVWREKEKDGVKKMSIMRSTFIIDKQGVVRYAAYGVTADGHAQEVLERVRQLQK